MFISIFIKRAPGLIIFKLDEWLSLDLQEWQWHRNYDWLMESFDAILSFYLAAHSLAYGACLKFKNIKNHRLSIKYTVFWKLWLTFVPSLTCTTRNGRIFLMTNQSKTLWRFFRWHIFRVVLQNDNVKVDCDFTNQGRLFMSDILWLKGDWWAQSEIYLSFWDAYAYIEFKSCLQDLLWVNVWYDPWMNFVWTVDFSVRKFRTLWGQLIIK